MTILGTQVTRYHSPYFGWIYCCYKKYGKYRGNVAYCVTIWEVIKFIIE